MIGNDLYVGGEFDAAGGVSANNIAKWDGSTWSALVSGITSSDPNRLGSVSALAVDASGHLFVGGQFSGAGTTSSTNIIQANLPCVLGTPDITWNAPATITNGTPLSATQSNATSTVEGTFTYTPPLDTLLPAGTGQTLSVTFSPSSAAEYAETTQSVVIDVAKAPLTITAGSITRAAGQANPTLTASYTGFVNGESASDLDSAVSITTTATIESEPGDYPITVSSASGANYEISFVAGTLTILDKVVPEIAWDAPAAITYGTPFSATQLNGTSTVEGTFTYTPALGTILGAGTGQMLSVSFAPLRPAEFAPATKTVSIDVARAALVITANDSSRAEGESNSGFSAEGDGGEQVFEIPTAGLGGKHFFRVTTAMTTPPTPRGFALIAAGSFLMGDQSPEPSYNLAENL